MHNWRNSSCGVHTCLFCWYDQRLMESTISVSDVAVFHWGLISNSDIIQPIRWTTYLVKNMNRVRGNFNSGTSSTTMYQWRGVEHKSDKRNTYIDCVVSQNGCGVVCYVRLVSLICSSCVDCRMVFCMKNDGQRWMMSQVDRPWTHGTVHRNTRNKSSLLRMTSIGWGVI